MNSKLEIDLFAGGGELGALMGAFDWKKTPLGPVDNWPQSLKTCVRIILTSRQPMSIWWGDSLINLYNDAYKTIIGSKHPEALGQPAPIVLREIWDQVGPRATSVMNVNEGSYDESLLVIMERNGYREETYCTISCNPIPNDQGGAGGILCTNTDDTQKVIGERQLALLRNLATRTADARTWAEACALSASSLTSNPRDLPFALIYTIDPERRQAILTCTSMTKQDHPEAPEILALDANAPWPLAEVWQTQKPRLISMPAKMTGYLPRETWPLPSAQAVVFPIAAFGPTGKGGILVVGLNPFRQFDESYRSFLGLAADQISVSLANALAYEEEKQRTEALTSAHTDIEATASPPARAECEMGRAFARGGEMGSLMRAKNWSMTRLGPFESWPQSLRATITTLLGSRYPMILLWSSDLIQLYNDAYIGLIGDKHPNALGRSIRETQAESWDTIGPMIHEVMSTGVPNWVPAQMMALNRSGYREEAYFSLSYSAVDNDSGQTEGMLCVCSEVTEQIVGERRLRLLRDLAFRAGETHSVETTCQDLARAIGDYKMDVPFALIYLRDEDGKTLHLQSAVGLDKGGPASPTVIDLAEGDEVWPFTSALAGETHVVEHLGSQIRVTTGPWNDVVPSALVMPLGSSRHTHPLGVFVAGTGANRALDESYSSFYKLLVGQVSVAILNARAYEEERKRAETLAEVDRAKTAFFSNISHEFRTPLTLILGPIEDALNERQGLLGERLELVYRNALRLYKMVNTLLDFSRIEAGRAQATFAPTDLSAFTADLASAFRSAAERAGLKLIVDCPPLPEEIYVDPEMWEKVVLNLLSNAVKYTYQGEIRVALHWKDEHAVLTVKDTGVGITEEDLPRVFERFYRTRVTQGRSFEGTGIGLALVQELVKLHGGRVGVTSTRGQGSIFTVQLPVGSGHLPPERVEPSFQPRSAGAGAAAFVQEALRWPGDEETAVTQAAAGADDQAAGLPDIPTDVASARILIVDDNADLRTYLVGLLGRMFHNVSTAAGGQAALDAARENPPDLILSDVMMPGLDGIGLVRELRADTRTRGIPTILLSARAGEESTVEGLKSGADDYLVKPFSARELIARVSTQMEMARVRREVHRHELAAEQLKMTVQDRDEFLSLVAHELRTPVSALQLQIQSLTHGPMSASLSDRVRMRMQSAERSIGRLGDMVNVILDISRLMSRNSDHQLQEVDLPDIVREVVEAFEVKALTSGSKISMNLAASATGIWDVDRIKQILSSLLSNALKYGAGKPIEIDVEAMCEVVRLSVRDHGIGLEYEKQQQIFQRFKRLSSARHHGGLGLGLWVVREVVEQMEGSVKVESTPGQGATFMVELPRNYLPT